MTIPRPLALVLVPPQWEAVPAELEELRRQVETGCGATLLLQASSDRLRRPLLLFFGSWDEGVKRRAAPLLHDLTRQAFFTLDWLAEPA